MAAGKPLAVHCSGLTKWLLATWQQQRLQLRAHGILPTGVTTQCCAQSQMHSTCDTCSWCMGGVLLAD